MTIDKAIEALQRFRDEGEEDLPPGVEDALEMSIAALGQFVFLRKAFPLFKLHELPGETKD